MQYRRLTAHLQTGSVDFNRRFSAYLTNHVAMRSALDQAITNSYAQQYPNAPQFAHNQQTMYPSPFLAHNMQQQQSPTSYVQSPYMAQGHPGFRPGHHARSASATGTQDTPGYTQPSTTQSSPVDPSVSTEPRRTSMPSKMPSKSVSPVTSRTPQPLQSRPSLPPKTSSVLDNQQTPAYNNIKQESQPSQPSQPMRAPPQLQVNQQPTTNMFGFQDFSPFSTALPAESQMLLGSALDPNDPLTSMMMAGSENMAPSNFFNSTPASLSKQRNFHPSYDGMSATLAPSALDMSQGMFGTQPPTTSASLGKPGFQLAFDSTFPDFTKGQPMFGGPNSSNGSGTVTPGLDGGWDAFINDNTWTENAT